MQYIHPKQRRDSEVIFRNTCSAKSPYIVSRRVLHQNCVVVLCLVSYLLRNFGSLSVPPGLLYTLIMINKCTLGTGDITGSKYPSVTVHRVRMSGVFQPPSWHVCHGSFPEQLEL